ncbi:MAG: NUDIX domain-containing protein [Sneathiella sp.]
MTTKLEKAPRVGCGALIERSDNRILLVKRLRNPEAGCWGFPGGKVDFGETVEDAICREIKEELGVSLTLNGLAHLVNFIDLKEGQHWLAPVYKATISNGTPSIMEPDALSELAWYALDELPDNLTEATRQTLTKG